MNKEMTSASSSKRPLAALMRSRWLWGVVVISIMFWGIKGLQRAMQPKYEGKTAAEWYASVSTVEVGFVSTGEAAELPVVIAFKNLGPEGCRYLWAEYTREVSPFSEWAAYAKVRLTKDADPFEMPRTKSMKAYFILQRLGPDAEPILPEVLEALTEQEPFQTSSAANLVAEIRRQPEKTIPVLLKSLAAPNLWRGDQIACIRAIEMYGASALPYLPQLKSALSNSVNDLQLRMSLAVAATRVSGDYSYLKTTLEQSLSVTPLNFDDYKALTAMLEQLNPEERAVVAQLRRQNPGWNNTFIFDEIMDGIRTPGPDSFHKKR